MTYEAPRPQRRRDPEASYAAILVAAREVFTELGYDRASVREIARRSTAPLLALIRSADSLPQAAAALRG